MKRRINGKSIEFTEHNLCYALEHAAEFLRREEWPEDDGGAQVTAYHEAASRILKMRDSITRKTP